MRIAIDRCLASPIPNFRPFNKPRFRSLSLRIFDASLIKITDDSGDIPFFS
jgi:hypothetical protein